MRQKLETKTVVFKNNTFKKVLFLLIVIAVCSSLPFASCKKEKEKVVVTEPIPQSEIQALKDFYKATGGENWKIKWDTTNNDISTWEGVDMRKIVVDLNNKVFRNAIGRITLPNNNLTGNIPIDILVQLKDITFIDFSNNQLTGGIPDALSQLKNIESIDFSNNELTGGIPESLSLLSNLSRLKLSYNNLTGTLPQAIKNMKNYSSFELCDQGNAEDYYCPFSEN